MKKCFDTQKIIGIMLVAVAFLMSVIGVLVSVLILEKSLILECMNFAIPWAIFTVGFLVLRKRTEDALYMLTEFPQAVAFILLAICAALLWLEKYDGIAILPILYVMAVSFFFKKRYDESNYFPLLVITAVSFLLAILINSVETFILLVAASFYTLILILKRDTDIWNKLIAVYAYILLVPASFFINWKVCYYYPIASKLGSLLRAIFTSNIWYLLSAEEETGGVLAGASAEFGWVGIVCIVLMAAFCILLLLKRITAKNEPQRRLATGLLIVFSITFVMYSLLEYGVIAGEKLEHNAMFFENLPVLNTVAMSALMLLVLPAQPTQTYRREEAFDNLFIDEEECDFQLIKRLLYQNEEQSQKLYTTLISTFAESASTSRVAATSKRSFDFWADAAAEHDYVALARYEGSLIGLADLKELKPAGALAMKVKIHSEAQRGAAQGVLDSNAKTGHPVELLIQIDKRIEKDIAIAYVASFEKFDSDESDAT